MAAAPPGGGPVAFAYRSANSPPERPFPTLRVAILLDY
ncbi:hypothetical protein PhaeoP71_01662 [Phaeobacter piscinae]|nr:hypothetical protein PhaeoP71_01662 [Phaeobacter piscinae]